MGFIIVAVAQPLFAELVKFIIDTIEHGNKGDQKYLPFLSLHWLRFEVLVLSLETIFSESVCQCRTQATPGNFNHYTNLSTEYFDAQNSGHLIPDYI